MTPVLKAIETERQPDAASLYTRFQAVRSSKCILVITVERHLHGRLTRHKEGRCKHLPIYGVKTSQSTSKWSVTGTPHINEFESTLGHKKIIKISQYRWG